MMYSAKVMEHFANPHNVGEMPDASGVGEVGNQKCGDIMKMYIKVENNVITDVKFLTFGCGAAIATSSMATDLIKGQPLSEALKPVSYTHLRIEQGQRFITDFELMKLAEILKVSVYYLLTGTQTDPFSSPKK